jgi:alpha-D-ribose 1-methylphosphonate 5-triphosphate synthase subunit PhnI
MYVAVKGGEKAIAAAHAYRNTDDGAMNGFPS